MLIKGKIVDENDFTSKFTGAIEEHFSSNFPLKVKSFSQKLPGSVEREWGVDGMILLVDQEIWQGKICLFEAKIKKNDWDYIQSRSNPPVFHFSTQLKRQITPDSRGYVVWEQLYDAEKGNSSCVLHKYAIEHGGDPTYPDIWKNSDVDEACNLQIERGLPVEIGALIKVACECTIGEVFSLDEIATQLNKIPSVENALLIEHQAPEYGFTLENELQRMFSRKRKNVPRPRS